MAPAIGRVIVGVDGSPGSLQALRFAVRHARALGAELVPAIAWRPPGGEAPNRRYPPALERELATLAGQRLVTAFDEAMGGMPTDLHVTMRAVRGEPGRVLVALADRPEDLLVTGRGSGFLRRLATGSVSRYCLAHARCPAVAVPPPPVLGRVWRARWSLRLRGVPDEGAGGGARPHRRRGADRTGHDSRTA